MENDTPENFLYICKYSLLICTFYLSIIHHFYILSHQKYSHLKIFFFSKYFATWDQHLAQHRKSSSHVGAPGSVSQSCSLFQLPAKSHPGRQQVIAQVLESLHPNGRPSLNSSLLTSAWLCPSCWEHLGKEPADTRSLSIPIFLCLFAFQINKKYF